ncbi:carbohydrate ABC transporter permease [Dactylosporangium sp. NPDC048998]|uniref:carbohydrate ABC transporter permease n=1 Tax=Dactylosporangium sp. NPDC048998 TaxID=3363976 RepID=UPI0037185022
MVTASATETQASRQARRTPTGRMTKSRLAVVLLSPTMACLALVVGYPVISAVRLAFQMQSQHIDKTTGYLTTTTSFGLGNFTDALTGDQASRFVNAFWNTTTFTVVSVGIETVIGVAMALVMHQAVRGRALVRAAILVPWAIPTAISGLLWRWVFASDGIANSLLNAHVLWTADGFPAWCAVIIADSWKTAPFIGLLVLAGLQTIPAEVYEAARLDGATGWKSFSRITLPLVRPVLVVAVLFRLLDVLRMFDLPYVLIGPRKGSVETLTMIAVDEMQNLHFGAASAYAVVLFLYIAAVVTVFVSVLGADVLGASGRKRPVR